MTDPIRWVGVVALLVPVLALLLWSWREAVRTDRAMAEEQRIAEARAALRARQDAYVRGQIAAIEAEIDAQLRFPSEEHPIIGDHPAIPEPNEAMAQLRAVMAGEIARCGVCKGTAPDLFKINLADNQVFCCGPCAAVFNAGAHQ